MLKGENNNDLSFRLLQEDISHLVILQIVCIIVTDFSSRKLWLWYSRPRRHGTSEFTYLPAVEVGYNSTGADLRKKNSNGSGGWIHGQQDPGNRLDMYEGFKVFWYINPVLIPYSYRWPASKPSTMVAINPVECQNKSQWKLFCWVGEKQNITCFK